MSIVCISSWHYMLAVVRNPSGLRQAFLPLLKADFSVAKVVKTFGGVAKTSKLLTSFATECFIAFPKRGERSNDYWMRPTLHCMEAMLIAMLLLSVSSLSNAQDLVQSGTFELSAPGVAESSVATVTPNELSVRDSAGAISRYQRLPRYDTADQQLLGYSSRQLQRVIRWPASSSGRMQIGTLNSSGQIDFTWSKMTVTNSQQARVLQPSSEILPPGIEPAFTGRVRNGAVPSGQVGNLLSLPSMTAMHLSVGNPNERQFLGLQDGDRFGFTNQATGVDSAWYIAPVSDNIVRLQQRRQNDWLAIGLGNVPDGMARSSRLDHRAGAFGGASFGGGAFPAGGSFGGGGFPSGSSFGGGGGRRANAGFPISFSRIHNGADQLWRIHAMQGSGGYCFESVLYPGMGLTCMPNQGLTLQSITYDPWQVWWPQAPTFALPQPQFRTVQHQVTSNPALRPVSARIVNSHSETLVVLVADRRHSQSVQKLRIPAMGSELVHLDRDPGGTIVETVETMDAFGNWNQQQYNTPIPPTVLYDISVYEEFLQSIAIDRTGKSPNPIEDVNYQPRSIGFFLVPPGDELPEVAEIDAYRIAEDSQNPGAVRRLNPRDLQKNNATPSADPLRELLNKFQKQRAAF